MIHKLRIKFIAASMLSLTLVLLVILGGVNIMSYQKILRDSEHILNLLSENRGAFPKQEFLRQDPPFGETEPKPGRRPVLGHSLSPETPFESRFFSVLLNAEGQVIASDMGQIAAIDTESAAETARKVWNTGKTSGFQGDYRYIRITENEGTRLIFLDCGRSLSNFRTTLFASILVALAGLLAVFLLLLILSERIVRPVAESYEKQRRFITDAGHELKTPLTIIGADLDLIDLELTGNEWLADIRRQTRRLTDLTQDLIYLSRMEEEKPPLHLIEFPLSDVIEEMTQSFMGPSKTQGKTFKLDIQPMISWTGDEKAIRQLCSILLDNALKYTPEQGIISVSLKKEGRVIRYTISNTISRPMDSNSLKQLFERFYRTDHSRNSQTGGYGLGLSIAKSIVASHRGKIRAYCPEPLILAVSAEFSV
jgi:two-component system sensor histidine kinase CiaH